MKYDTKRRNKSADKITGDSHIHNLPLEASWAGKFAGLSNKESIDLVSRNIEEILGLASAKDFVVYEGNPLELGASVVVAFDGEDGDVDGESEGGVGVSLCWPGGS